MDETKILGQAVSRIDAPDKVTGRALPLVGPTLPDLLHMKILFSDREAPVNEYDLQKPDQWILCGP